MNNTSQAERRANSVFRSESPRHEKGSAMGLIKADATAVQQKTARLRALRLEREAADAGKAADAKTEASPKKKTRARRSA
ncbi:hypothetical protein [Consotaella salsifontis]|uniref:Uncharacterized protein n=1 Tax=Consotaella salsifontis TaxID=1365950 RepID=A0A1T4RZC9_9HYPH|nr:hypothetical protein [Consotaella salsifontis]SKA21374.1 hypothetical protein SAMN05428963_108113 [Consotaella salsifontis]